MVNSSFSLLDSIRFQTFFKIVCLMLLIFSFFNIVLISSVTGQTQEFSFDLSDCLSHNFSAEYCGEIEQKILKCIEKQPVDFCVEAIYNDAQYFLELPEIIRNATLRYSSLNDSEKARLAELSLQLEAELGLEYSQPDPEYREIWNLLRSEYGDWAIQRLLQVLVEESPYPEEVTYLDVSRSFVERLNRGDEGVPLHNAEINTIDDSLIRIEHGLDNLMFGVEDYLNIDSIVAEKTLKPRPYIEKDAAFFNRIYLAVTNKTPVFKAESISVNVNLSVKWNETGMGLILTSNKVSATTNLNLLLNESGIFVRANQTNTFLSVFPDEALKKASGEIDELKVLELRSYEDSLTYRVQGVKKVKIFWLIPWDMDVELTVNAGDGNIISIKKPWWRFLAW